LIILLFLSGNSFQKDSMKLCKIEKSLFHYPYDSVICLDTIKNYKQLKKVTDGNLENHCYINYGFVYDYENFSFTPNIDAEIYIFIFVFQIFKNSFAGVVRKVIPPLSLILNKPDTIEFITRTDFDSSKSNWNTLVKMKISDNEARINKFINDYYIEYCNNNIKKEYYKIQHYDEVFNYPLIHICINDEYSFNEVMSSYYKNTTQIIRERFNSSICELDSLKMKNFRFTVNINDSEAFFVTPKDMIIKNE